MLNYVFIFFFLEINRLKKFLYFFISLLINPLTQSRSVSIKKFINSNELNSTPHSRLVHLC